MRNAGSANPNYKGGSVIDKDGYVRLRGEFQFQLEHRVIAEKALGRPLADGEVVHHINEIRTDNRNENLLICTEQYHRLIHTRMKALEACGNASWRRCRYCKQYDDPANMTHLKSQFVDYHKKCATEYQRSRIKKNGNH